MPGPGAALDGGRVQAVDVELVADFLEQAQLAFGQRAVGSGHVAGQRVGGLEELLGQVVAHQPEERIQPVLLTEEIEHHLRDAAHTVEVIVAEDGQVVHRDLDLDQFGGADFLVRGRDGDHDGHEAILGAERMGDRIGHGGPFGISVLRCRILTLPPHGNR